MFTGSKDIYNIASNDGKYISHLVGQNESLLERIKVPEVKVEELAVLEINKDLGDSRILCDLHGWGRRISRGLFPELIYRFGLILTYNSTDMQLEIAIAVSKEEPSVVANLRSNIEKLGRG